MANLYPTVAFICMCVMIKDVEHLFTCLLNMHVSSLEKCLVVHSLSRVWLFMTPWTAASPAALSFTVSQSLLTPLSDESVMPCNHLILCDSSSPSALNISQSGSFPVSWFLASGGQSIGASGSASGLPMNVQGSHALGLTGFISLQHSGLTRVFAATTVQKQQFFGAQPSLRSSSHIHT